MKRSPYLLLAAIFVYCILNMIPLSKAWFFAPMELYGWLAFLIWASPVAIYWILKVQRKLEPHPWNSVIYGLAIFFMLFGELTTLNALKYIGVAFAVFGLVPFYWGLFVWLVGAFCWMPVFGWIGSYTLPQFVLPMRLFLALVTAGCACLTLSKNGRLRP